MYPVVIAIVLLVGLALIGVCGVVYSFLRGWGRRVERSYLLSADADRITLRSADNLRLLSDAQLREYEELLELRRNDDLEG